MSVPSIFGRPATRYIIAALALFGTSCGGGTAALGARSLPATATVAAAAEVGLATYYSSRLSGRRTASGERYDPKALTAAHRSLPFGTVVRVVRVDARGGKLGAPVLVRVNDRGPFSGGRILDVSMAAARRLGMLRAGVVRVRVEVVSSPRRPLEDRGV